MFPSRAAVDLTEDEWHRVIDVNLTSTLLFSQAAARSMIELRSGGVIVNVCSRAGLRPRPGMLAYSAAKVGVVSLTQTMARSSPTTESGSTRWLPARCHPVRSRRRTGRRSVALLPPRSGKPPNYSRIPMKRAAQPDEVALPVLFLASPAASYITGAVLVIHGGASLP
jgi:NAD(P)-dependent dehydrogenase (short-subunit alcohol dehydrogenase family)